LVLALVAQQTEQLEILEQTIQVAAAEEILLVVLLVAVLVVLVLLLLNIQTLTKLIKR
jgi:hypothetical protein